MIKRLIFVICNLSFVILFLLPSPALAATLSLSPASGTFGPSCNFAVDVVLDTEGVETDGTDAILLFNPQQLTVNSIEAGRIYADFPGNTIDNSSGKVSIYALAPTDKGYTGKGTLATINFTTNATASAGLATVSVDFDPSNPTKTIDSNVIQRSDLKDVLSVVTSGEYTLNSNTEGCTGVKKAAVIGGATDSLPESGIWEVTLMVGGIGVFLVIMGAFGLKKTSKTIEIRR